MHREPTHDEIMLVRRWECRKYGHAWRILEKFAVGPVALVCDRCGDSRKVVKE